ncbi:uncharacterized protein [Penaeus vannamei]
MAEEGRVEIGEASAGCKMEESMSNLGGAPVVCLVCDRVIKELHRQDVPNVFLENSVTSHSQQQLANMLSVILKSPLESSQVYSKTLCRRCFRLLDELDGIEQRSVVLKTTIEELYNRSLLRRMKGPRVNEEETIGAMDLGLPEDDEEDDGSKISVKVEPLDDDEDFLADELRPEDQGIRPDDPEFNPAHDNMWRSKSRSKGRGRGRGRSRGRARGRGRGRGPGRPPKNIKDEDATTSKAGESLGEKLGQLVNKILGDDESEEPVDMETETPTTSAGTEEEVDAAEKALQVTRPREPGKRVPVLSWKMRLSMAELSRKSKSLPQSESQREIKREPKDPEDGQELRAKRQYRKRPHIIHLCKFCMKVCPTGEKLKEHQKTHDSIECQFCGKVMARIGAWENHLKTFHNVEIQVPGSEEALNRPKEEVDCRICGKQFSSKTALAYHSKLHDGKTYTCDTCGKLFNHPSNLKTHKLRHEKKNYYCDKCGKGFHTNFALLMHDNQSHRMAKSWKCKHCGKAFTRGAAFKEHIRIHTGEKPFECNICGVKFRKIHHLKTHAKQHEPKMRDGPFKCHECPNAVFLHKISYDRHRKFKHGHETLITEGNVFLPPEIVIKGEYMVPESEGRVGTGYVLEGGIEGVEGIEMVGLDEGSLGTGTQGGQCIIVLSETANDDANSQAFLQQVEVAEDIKPQLISQEDEEEEEEEDEGSEVHDFDEAQLASLQEHIQLNDQMTAAQLQQLSVATLEGGKFQVQMDGETFDVYTVNPTE